jgi:superfamily II DNA or RNA helicase
MQAFKEGAQSVCITAPTGGGKTAVAAWWAQQCDRRGRRVLVLTHKNTIQKQMMETFYKFGLTYGAIASGRPIISERIQIAMIGTLINKLDHIYPPDWIIGDEQHHWSEGNMWGRAVRHYQKKNPDLKILGLTATPSGMTDGRGLWPFVDVLIDELSLEYLVREGWLVYPHTMVGEKREPPKFHITRGDYDKKEQNEYFKKKHVVGNAVENYQQYMDGLPIIVSCVSLDHAHFMQQQYEQFAKDRGKSWKAVMIQGGKKYEKQMFQALEGMATGSVQIVTFVDVLGEGVDVPACSGIQLLRKIRSRVLIRQFIGRVLRPWWPDGYDQYNSTVDERTATIARSFKPLARVQDFAGNYRPELHGHPIIEPHWTLAETRGKRKKSDEFPSPEVTVCGQCTAVWPGHPRVCPDCGCDLEEQRERAAGRKPPREIEGILREVMPESGEDLIAAITDQALRLQQMDPADRQRAMMSNLYRHGDGPRNKGLAEALGYKKNWVDTVYRRIQARR